MRNATVGSLSNEHRNIEMVLGLIRLNIRFLSPKDKDALQLLTNAIGYMQNYPALVHDAKDKLLAEKLLRRDPSMAEACNKLRDLRQRFRDQELEMLRLLWRVRAGSHEACERLKQTAGDYCTRHADYIRTEEQLVLPAAVDSLPDADWREIAERFGSVADPLFGARVVHNKEALYDRLMAMGERNPVVN